MNDNHLPPDGSPFAAIHIGAIITRFGEQVIRVHHGTFSTSPPTWFAPDQNKNQGAQHRDGFSVYWEVEINEATRTEAHPFEGEVAAHAIFTQQLVLF